VNIEQKNTLFIVGLVLVVLFSVGGLAYFLVRDHVANSIHDDLDRARKVFIKAQKTRFDNLVTIARSARAEPSLVAATLTGDIATVRGMLDDLFPRPGADFMAVYLDTGPGGVAAAGNKPHFTAPQVLNSQSLMGLVKRLIRGDELVYGNALLYDTLLQLVAMPIENPLGGRIGALLIGRQFTQADLDAMRELVYADIVVYSGNSVLLTSIPKLSGQPAGLGVALDGRGVADFSIAGEPYSGLLLPVLNQVGSKDEAARVLLAAPHSRYWAPYRMLGENALYFSALILMVAALLGISISRNSLTRPIQLLARATQAIASGDLNHKVTVKRDDELGQLTQSFNTMLSALNASRAELEKSRQRFHDFADSSSDWLWETDRAARFTYVSGSVSDTLSIPADQLKGKTLQSVFPGSSLAELMALLRPAQTPIVFKDVEVWVTTLQADQHCLRLNGVPIIVNGKFRGYRGTARDITKLKQDEKRMVILANQDHLTGLANRRRFLLDLNHEIRRVERHGQLGVLVLIDLDHLKLVNDTAGHAAGDQIIVQVAGLLKRASREQDLLARVSGDEFAVAYSAMDEQQGLEKAQELLGRITSLKPRYGGRAINISASIGVVTFPTQGTVPVELLAKADAAMSGAKQAGRNRVHLYDDADMMRERMDSQLVWKDRLLDALDNDRLALVFQPIVSVANGRIHHYEVLVRLRDGEGRLVAPGKFIPAAEQFGFIQRVDRAIVSKAIRILAALPPEKKDIGFAINLSGMSVGDPDVFGLIQREVCESGIEPKRLTFEITETAACEQLNNAIEFIQKIRQLGCQVALDDFGVGFSSFSYLKHLRADVLKIDGSFIRDIHNNNADQLFVKALVDVARGMGMQTTAEFVENEHVYERVRSLGVDFVQGYYLGKPLGRLQAEKKDLKVAPVVSIAS